jgi:hypothetical protein
MSVFDSDLEQAKVAQRSKQTIGIHDEHRPKSGYVKQRVFFGSYGANASSNVKQSHREKLYE